MKSIEDYWLEKTSIDVVPAAVVSVLVGAALYGGKWNGVQAVIGDGRGAFYGLVASIFGSLLGFIISALAIITGLIALEKFSVLRKSKIIESLWKAYSKAISSLSVATFISIFASLIDRDKHPVGWIFLVFVFVASIAVLRLWRAIRIVLLMVHRVRDDWSQQQTATAP